MRVAVNYRQASRENYERFLQENKHIKISYVAWQNVIYTFNYNFRDYLLETGEKAKLPWGIGDFSISKRKRKKFKILPNGDEVLNLAIDWKKTKEQGFKCYHFNYHTEGFNFKWRWFNKSARYRWSNIWCFKPSRITSRLLKHYLSQPDMQHMYQEWDMIK